MTAEGSQGRRTRQSVPRNRYALSRDALAFFPRLGRLEDHPQSWAFPPWLDSCDAPWLRELRALYGRTESFPASVSPQAGLLLHALVLNARPRLAVEVGTFLGASTLWIASALEGGARLWAVDDFGPIPPGPWRSEPIEGDREALVRARVERAGLADRVELHRGDSAATLEGARRALADAGGVDLALLDGDHSIDGVARDFAALEPVLNTGGLVVLHDTFPEQCGSHEGPRTLLDRVSELGQGVYEACDLYLSPLNYGLGVLRRIG